MQPIPEADLEEAFYRYMERVVRDLQSERQKHAATLAAYPTFETTLLDRVLSKIESAEELQSLVQATQAALPPERLWCIGEQTAKNFFRRAGIYDALKKGRVPDVGPALESYRTAFLRTHKRVTHLAPLEFLCLSGSSLKFHTFELRKLSASELEAFLGQPVNRSYFKDAVVDPENWHHYWWLITHCDEPLPTGPSGAGEISLRAELHLTRHPELEFPTKILALYNWLINPLFVNHFGDGVPGATWTPPYIPFVIAVHDYLLESPFAIEAKFNADFQSVSYEPDSDEHPYGPLDYWNFDEARTAEFENFLRRSESMVLTLAGIQEWQFVRTALDYLLKAFENQGKEQLVWHMIALESLLGQRGEALTESIGQRLAVISSADPTEQRKIKKKFRELYNFRCDIVHGNAAGKEMLVDHLNEARYFARDTFMWFIHFLTGLHAHWVKENPGQALPSRADLLCLLDLSPSARKGIGLFKGALPEAFPCITDWVE
jgi:hypothetical protein